MRDKRREKTERELAAAETEFREKLLEALRICAGGFWGLFGQNSSGIAHLDAEAAERSGARELLALGTQIAGLRNDLGIAEPFALHARLLALRGRKTRNDLGEPRLAQTWLAELNA